MSKSPLGYAPFGEGFSAGSEGGDFIEAAPTGTSRPTVSTRRNGGKATPKSANGKARTASNTQSGGRRKRRRRRTRRRTRGGKRRRRHKRKSMPDKGWAKLAPFGHARTVMLRKCGRKCFLGPKKSFPICAKGTCKRNRKGIEAAYVRARQWGKPRSSYKSKGKYVTYHGRKGTRRVWMKGSRPRHRRRTYQRVARRAKALLRRRR